MAIGNIIRTLRKEMNLTQDGFAKKVGIHGRQLGKYEIGENTPSINVLIKMSRFFEVSLDYLVYGSDNKLAEKLRLKDQELLDMLRRIDLMKKPEREKIKWVIHGLIDHKETLPNLQQSTSK